VIAPDTLPKYQLNIYSAMMKIPSR